MENFILYEKLGAGSRSVVHKGRLKSSLNYVAIACSDKNKRPEITNHVRLSHDFDHPNIVSFYEWYETSNHLWLVVELCTGGSLESLVVQDGYLSEDVVRGFGWGLVQGLKYIHEMGVILSDLTPAKILLDNSGILKFGNFCLSKAEGETMGDFFALLSNCEILEQGEQFDIMRTKLQGSLFYKAPEVLLGSETNISTDLWALGCILYYMYTGNPPFYCDNSDELTDLILHKEPAPLRQTVPSATPPSECFSSLLKGLLNKDPYNRMNWPELLQHSFWIQAQKEGDLFDEEEVVNDADDEEVEEDITDCEIDCSVSERSPTDSLCPKEPSKQLIDSLTLEKGLTNSKKEIGPDAPRNENANSYSMDTQTTKKSVIIAAPKERICDGERKVDKLVESLHSNKSMTLDSLSDFRPKKGGDEDHTEAIFLLRKNLSLSECNPASGFQPTAVTDMASSIKALLFTDSDLSVTPIMDNPKILKNTPVRFDAKTLCVPSYSVEKLLSLNEDDWSAFLEHICSFFEEQHSTSLISSPATPTTTSSTATRSKLNLLCYLCCVVGQKNIANKLVNSILLSVLTQQIRLAPNWDLRSKVLRVLGLMALHCTELGQNCPVSEVVTTLTDLLRENLRNSKVKHFLLPPLGEFLYLIASQQEKRGSPEGLWFVPAAAYTGLMRSLREGDDPVVHHMAAKAIENIATVVSGPAHSLVTSDTGPALWYLFTHSSVEAVRVTAISALSRITRVVPAVFSSVIDICGPAAILEAVGGAGARVQQHLLTALASALLTAKTHTHRITQSQDLVLKALRCLESPSTVTRAKAVLLLLLLLQDNTHTLLYCCQYRLVMYLERDLRKATSLRENTGQLGYLSQCLELMTAYLSHTAPQILDDVLCALKGVTGRRHPSTVQGRQLKQTLPNLSIVLELLSSQVFRSQIVTERFLVNIGQLLDHIISIDSNETNLACAVGAAVCDDLIRTTLSIVEVLSQHQTLIPPHHSTVVDNVLPPLMTLAFSKNVECCVFVLQVLSELSLVLLLQDADVTEEENTQKVKRTALEKPDYVKEEESTAQLLALISNSLLSRYENLLRATEPVPLYALKLLVSITEHSTPICRLIKRSTILPLVFQLITVSNNNVTSGMVQNAVALLCNLTGDTILDLDPAHQQGLMEMVVRTLTEASLHVERGLHDRRRVSQPVLPALPALLELLHNILKQTSSVVRSALQSQRLSCPVVETEAAEKLLLANRPLSQVSTQLIHMLSTEHEEVWEESLQCLSILVQLYGGEGQDCLSASCLRSFKHVLRSHMHSEHPRTPRTALRIIKRLMETVDPDKSDWTDCSDGAELLSVIQEIARSDRCHVDVVSLAAEILNQIE
uniref:Unc-51 like kinase 4 n=1 Tax=Neogobius melanostomus TaxID=47308 RepID=A0A8C6UVP2_9GOBI